MPAWQTKMANYYFANAKGLPAAGDYNTAGRGYPDIASQSEMFTVVSDGIPMPGVGGTSCAAPTSSGIFSLLNEVRLQAGKTTLGFLNPMIYLAAAKEQNIFNDAITGIDAGCSFVGFPAWKGWDACSGNGSPNFRLLSQIVSDLP